MMGEAVAIEAYLSMAGEITPRRFTWYAGGRRGGVPLTGVEWCRRSSCLELQRK